MIEMINSVLELMNIGYLMEVLTFIWSASLSEAFTYLCENIPVGTFVIYFVAYRFIRQLSRGLSAVLKLLNARPMAASLNLQRDLFSGPLMSTRTFYPETSGSNRVNSTNPIFVESADSVNDQSSFTIKPLV